MRSLHVTVIVQDNVWDQFSVSSDQITFVAFSSQSYTNNDIELTLLEHNIEKVSFESQENKAGCDVQDTTGVELKGDSDISLTRRIETKFIHTLYINGYLLSLFVKTLRQSAIYRRCVIANFKNCRKRIESIPHPTPVEFVNMKLVCPHKNVIDFAWNERLEKLTLERRELDNAMSWLSTLGGAFSALGDESQHCAEIAGQISVQQFNIALRLGDPNTVARCKLYLALSMVQRDCLVLARRIIEQQYYLATSAVVVDRRLVSMCLGMWAKLKYEHKRKRKK